MREREKGVSERGRTDRISRLFVTGFYSNNTFGIARGRWPNGSPSLAYVAHANREDDKLRNLSSALRSLFFTLSAAGGLSNFRWTVSEVAVAMLNSHECRSFIYTDVFLKPNYNTITLGRRMSH